MPTINPNLLTRGNALPNSRESQRYPKLRCRKHDRTSPTHARRTSNTLQRLRQEIATGTPHGSQDQQKIRQKAFEAGTPCNVHGDVTRSHKVKTPLVRLEISPDGYAFIVVDKTTQTAPQK